jgi:hypothetical protein
LKIFNDIEEEGEVINDANPLASSECTKPSSMPKEVP